MPTTTRIEVTPDGCRFTEGALAVRRLRSPGEVRLALVATQALLLAGDHVRLEVDVRGDVALTIVETAGTVAYDMRGGSACWEVDVVLRDAARLTWHGEPFVVAAGADVVRSTTLDLAGGTAATVRESLVLGRSGESGGALLASTRATYDGTPLLLEDLDAAILAPHRCLDSLTTYGHRLPDEPGLLQLAGPGTVRRWLGGAQHRSPLN